MKNDKIAKPETAALPHFPGMNLPDVLLWPMRMQELLWRETLLTMARMAELRAECLRNMAQVTLPMDAAALQNDYASRRPSRIRMTPARNNDYPMTNPSDLADAHARPASEILTALDATATGLSSRSSMWPTERTHTGRPVRTAWAIGTSSSNRMSA